MDRGGLRLGVVNMERACGSARGWPLGPIPPDPTIGLRGQRRTEVKVGTKRGSIKMCCVERFFYDFIIEPKSINHRKMNGLRAGALEDTVDYDALVHQIRNARVL